MGCSIFSWGILGLLHDHQTFGITPVRTCLSVLHFCVGVLFLFRHLEIRAATFQQNILVLPCFVFCGLLFVNAQNISLWSIYCEGIFLIGTIIAVCSLIGLGRSFALLPGKRMLITTGPYRLIRHPTYFGESLMLLACVLSNPILLTYCLGGLSILSVCLRIHVEETFWGEEYTLYKSTVKWRLIPKIW